MKFTGAMLAKPRPEKKGPAGGKWTQEEDSMLRDIVQEHGPKSWKKVASLLGSNRTDVQCLHRWNKVLKCGKSKVVFYCSKGKNKKNKEFYIFVFISFLSFPVVLENSAANDGLII